MCPQPPYATQPTNAINRLVVKPLYYLLIAAPSCGCTSWPPRTRPCSGYCSVHYRALKWTMPYSTMLFYMRLMRRLPWWWTRCVALNQCASLEPLLYLLRVSPYCWYEHGSILTIAFPVYFAFMLHVLTLVMKPSIEISGGTCFLWKPLKLSITCSPS